MSVRLACALYLICLGLIFSCSRAYAIENKWGNTQCDEWANFSKIIAYKFRDTRELGDVEDELTKVQANNPELPIAKKLVALVYYKKDISPADIWHIVYNQCMMDRSI